MYDYVDSWRFMASLKASWAVFCSSWNVCSSLMFWFFSGMAHYSDYFSQLTDFEQWIAGQWEKETDFITPSFPYFLPFPFLTYCAILPISFGGKGSHLRWRLVAHPSSYGLITEFPRVFLCCKVNASISVHSLRFQLITFIISRQNWLTWHSGKVIID